MYIVLRYNYAVGFVCYDVEVGGGRYFTTH